jgi:HSP20 family molecular chaperone IbpA
MFYAVTTRPNTTPNNGTARISSNGPLDKFLSDTLSSLSNSGAARAPSVEDLETGYKLQLDVPGLSKEQLDIGIEGDVVRVTSKADAPRQVKAAWRFPLEVDVAASSATLENGVLTLTLGKKIPVSNVSQLVIQ